MRYALLIFVAVVSSTAGHRYGNLPTSASYALPASVTSAAAASRASSVGTTTATNPSSIKESPTPTATTESAGVSGAESAAAGESSAAAITQAPPTAITIPAVAAASSTVKNEEAVSESLTELPIASPPTAILPSDSDTDSPQRRVITYDQRQEGQYNIRADLENFMIVLIPPSPSEGLDLLDLLSSVRRSSLRSKSKRKHFTNGAANTKYRHPLKSSATLPTSLQYIGHQQSPNQLDRSRGYLTAPQFVQTPFDAFIGAHGSPASVLSSLGATSNRLSDLIEGRTASRFDIAANEDNSSADLHPDRPVDVLPPPYPLAYQHLIKPYHLEAEPTVIQALPPPELNSAPARVSGNYLDSYNQLLAPGLRAGNNAAAGDVATISTTTTTAAALPTDNGAGYYRISRAIRGDSFLDTNRLSSPNSIHQSSVDLQPLYRSDHSLGATYLYPPIDTPRLYFNPESNGKSFEAPHDAVDRSQVLDDVEDNARVGELYVPPRELKDDIEWEQFFDTMVKEANDSLCMPGQRRDSYGICRQVEGY